MLALFNDKAPDMYQLIVMGAQKNNQLNAVKFGFLFVDNKFQKNMS